MQRIPLHDVLAQNEAVLTKLQATQYRLSGALPDPDPSSNAFPIGGIAASGRKVV
jgi:hypothetical protein